ncbi:hypothetical protein RU639_009025 [Aspergillus parasiticus]
MAFQKKKSRHNSPSPKLSLISQGRPRIQVLITRHRRPGYGTKSNVPFFITTQEVKQAVRLGYKGFALTVNAVRAGKRERDLRVSMSQRSPKGTNPDDDDEEADGFAGEPSVGRPAVQSRLDWTSAIYRMASRDH